MQTANGVEYVDGGQATVYRPSAPFAPFTENAMLMSDLQQQSPSGRIIYWFDSAYGVLKPRGWGSLVYLGTRWQVVEALATGRRSRRDVVNEILDTEREVTP